MSGSAPCVEDICSRTISSQRNSKFSSLYHDITMTKSSGEDLDQDFSFLGLFQLFILNGEGLICFVEDGHFVGLWKRRSHIDD